jgi:hypothetical protein
MRAWISPNRNENRTRIARKTQEVVKIYNAGLKDLTLRRGGRGGIRLVNKLRHFFSFATSVGIEQ